MANTIANTINTLQGLMKDTYADTPSKPKRIRFRRLKSKLVKKDLK